MAIALANDVDDDRPAPPPEPQPWWRIIPRIKWLFGLGRSDLEVQAFVGVIYAAAEGYARRVPGMGELAETLQGLRARPDMPAAMACERQYYELLPSADRKAEIWALRDRFQRVATPEALAGFNATKITDVAAADEAAIASEVRAILSYTHKSYQLAAIREVAAGRLKMWLLIMTCLLMASFGGALIAYSEKLGILAPRSLMLGVAAIMLAGGVGAVMSVARRLQGAISSKVMRDDPLFEIAALELGRAGILLSCLIGSVFALLVFGVIYGGVGQVLGLGGGLIFPNLSHHMLGHQGGIAHALGFQGDGDVARMLMIAFIAGFAERLVPDSIDRIVSQNAGAKA